MGHRGLGHQLHNVAGGWCPLHGVPCLRCVGLVLVNGFSTFVLHPKAPEAAPMPEGAQKPLTQAIFSSLFS